MISRAPSRSCRYYSDRRSADRCFFLANRLRRIARHWHSKNPDHGCPRLRERAGPGRASFDAAVQEWPELRARLANAQLGTRERGAVTSMRSLRRVQNGNVALVGDASGSVDAITGEGLRMAFQQATALAEAMVEGALKSYEHAHRALVRRPMLMGDLMLWLARNPRIRRRVVGAMKSRPDLFERFLATHVGMTDPKSLLSAGAQLGWQLLHV
jgi:menaquinone-9 beta-reductase